MPITTRKSAFTRYSPGEGTLSKMDTMTFEANLCKMAFKPIDETGDIKSTGWTSAMDINDSEFLTQTAATANFFVWCMRIDKRNVPAAALRNDVNKAIAQDIKRTGKNFLSRERKQEIKDQCYLRLRSRMPAVPKIVQCVYDGERDVIYFGSSSNDDMLTFEELFFASFETVPVLVSPSDRAVAIMGDDVTTALMNIHVGEGSVEYPLYCDFLLWMWYKAETFKGGNFTLASGEYSATVDEKVSVVEFSGREVVSVVDTKTKDEDCEFSDTKYGLWKFNRTVNKIRMNVTRANDDFTFDIDASKPSSMTVKTPALHLNGESVLNDSPFLEKMALLDVAQNFMDDMYTLFVKARLSNRWASERKNIDLWLEASAPECERGYSDSALAAKTAQAATAVTGEADAAQP